MHDRCGNPKSKDYANYGERGIAVCERWSKFENFLRDMGVKPAGLTLERKNNEHGYAPYNCRWATRKDQARNKRSTRWITHDGVKLHMAAWAAREGVTPAAIHKRMCVLGRPVK